MSFVPGHEPNKTVQVWTKVPIYQVGEGKEQALQREAI